MAQLFRAGTALTEDPRLVRSSHIRWFTMACKSSLKGSDAMQSFAGTCTPVAGAYEYRQHAHTQCILLCIASEREERQAGQIL